MRRATRVCVMATLAWLAGVVAAHAAGEEVISPHRADAQVIVADLKHDAYRVSGLVVNKSGNTLRDVILMINLSWVWRDEMAPGEDNPGRSARYVLDGDIPPRSTMPFTYRIEPPLPLRYDGEFRVFVNVGGFTEVLPPREPGLNEENLGP
jgi:hypothetical protein